MKVLIFGADGYIGWPLVMALKDCVVSGLDSYVRRDVAHSIVPIELRDVPKGEMTLYGDVSLAIKNFQPDTIVHLAQQPSAAYSMKSMVNCLHTQVSNIVGTLHILYAMKEYAPKAHLIKIGTMGEYGTPDELITEDYQNRDPGSWYHASKVHDSVNIKFACKIWGLKATDIMQGIVYGINGEPHTRLDVDECFGTVVHRFCAQKAIGMPLTVYGDGSQKRSFLPLNDSIQCLKLLIENPPEKGEYRVVNQFHEIYSILDIASKISDDIQFVGNPRREKMNRFYEVESKILPALGYKPSSSLDQEIAKLIEICRQYKDRINPEDMMPIIRWN